jgi:hypothetical protein
MAHEYAGMDGLGNISGVVLDIWDLDTGVVKSDAGDVLPDSETADEDPSASLERTMTPEYPVVHDRVIRLTGSVGIRNGL